MKKLPIGLQEYRDLIEENCVYVDKTEDIISLTQSRTPIFFSRPRRFGKSLLTNTIKELFLGSKALFKDTWAYDNWDFDTRFEVIQLDLSTITATTADDLSQQLQLVVSDCAEDFGIEITESLPGRALRQLIKKVGKGKAVVILIDEYDTPILDNFHNEHLAAIKETLRGFYKVLKANGKYIRFLLVTGISKFTHVSIFSALNHLDDITLQSRYAALAGYTQQEIKQYFSQQIAIIKQNHSLSEELFWEKLQLYYNGYSWDGKTFVYNPLSILKFFNTAGEFRPYWMETGSPAFIVNYVQGKRLDITDFESIAVELDFLNRKDIDDDAPESFLTQAGYLTIKAQREDRYILDFPNDEVRHSFNRLILSNSYDVQDSDLLGVKDALLKALENAAIDEIIAQFKILYSSIPYNHFDSNKTEHFYTAVLLMYLQATGFDTYSERLSNKGRLDISLHYQESVYIFELKVNESPKKAIEQIVKNNYAGCYANKQVVLVGIQLDFSERNIIAFASESL